MKTKFLIIIFVALALIAGFAAFFLFQCEDDWCYIFHWQSTQATEWKRYDSEKFGIQFEYPKEYFLETKELGDGHRGHFAIVLTEDTEENRLVREGKSPGREGPLAITFDLYQTPETLDPLQWAPGHSGSNFKLSDGTYTQSLLAGREALFYSWDGLYRADNVVVQNRDYMASIAVTYLAEEDPIRKDFGEILKTLKFR